MEKSYELSAVLARMRRALANHPRNPGDSWRELSRSVRALVRTPAGGCGAHAVLTQFSRAPLVTLSPSSLRSRGPLIEHLVHVRVVYMIAVPEPQDLQIFLILVKALLKSIHPQCNTFSRLQNNHFLPKVALQDIQSESYMYERGLTYIWCKVGRNKKEQISTHL